jgi:hypothetical protein
VGQRFLKLGSLTDTRIAKHNQSPLLSTARRIKLSAKPMK